jgi:hypothetical protein
MPTRRRAPVRRSPSAHPTIEETQMTIMELQRFPSRSAFRADRSPSSCEMHEVRRRPPAAGRRPPVEGRFRAICVMRLLPSRGSMNMGRVRRPIGRGQRVR